MAEQKLDANVRFLGQVGLTTVLWAGTFVATKTDWLGHPATLPMRVALVTIGFGGFLPIVFTYAKSIRLQDEFSQRVHYIALSIAFAVTAVLSYGSDLMVQAGFIPPIPAMGIWALMVAIWFVSMIVTPRFYR